MTEERRERVLTEQDLAAISEMVSRTRPMADEIHLKHHQFLSEWIDRTRRRAETMDKIRAQVGGWSIIVVLGGIGFAVWEWFKTHLK